MWNWLETTTVALTVRDSLFLTAFLSGLHIVGMTIVAGATLVTALRLTGATLRAYPVPDVASNAVRAVFVGLALSVTTGALMFAPRASRAVENGFFQWKMLLLVIAVLFHLFFTRAAVSRPDAAAADRAIGAISLLLWLSVVALGAAYILLE